MSFFLTCVKLNSEDKVQAVLFTLICRVFDDICLTLESAQCIANKTICTLLIRKSGLTREEE